MATALALRERIEALFWQLTPAIFEQVFDKLAPPDAHVQISALNLDLGRVRPDHLEEDTLAALKAALSDALSGALLRARAGNADDSRLLSDQEIRLEQFAAFLASGVIPLSNRAAPFDASASLRYLIMADPAALAAMLRRRAQDRYVLERLVMQTDEADLAMLLAALAPADAQTILALLGDVILTHRRTRSQALRKLSEPALTSLLWVTTFEFLLRDAGTQFNRRRFLEALIAREARQLNISYDALLDLLSEAVQATAARSPLQSSLPATLTELLAERRRTPANDPPFAAHALNAHENGREPDNEARNVPAAPPFERLAETLSPFAFAKLIRELEPAAAASIIGDCDALAALHARAPILPMGNTAFVRRLRTMILSHIAEHRFGPFDRKAMWRLFLRELASAGHITQSALAVALEHRLKQSTSGAVEIVRALIADSNPAAATPPSPHSETFDDREISEPDAVERLIRLIQAGAAATDLTAMVGALSDTQFAAVLAHFEPGPATLYAGLIADIDALIALHGQVPLFDIDRHALDALVRASLLMALARPGAKHGRRALGKAVIREMARAARRSPAEFAAMLNDRRLGYRTGNRSGAPRSPELFGSRPDPIDGMIPAGYPGGSTEWSEWHQHIEHFLRTGQPQARGADLPELARKFPEWLAATSLRLARESPADATRLARRLLDWLLPQEIVSLLAPQQATETLHAANQFSGGDLDYWQTLVVALLRKEPPVPKGKMASGPEKHLDRMFRLCVWLDQGWSTDSENGGTADSRMRPADLLDLNTVELTDLLLAESPERTLARLSVAIQWLGPQAGKKLLARLAPWAAKENGPLASPGEAIMLRAAAMALSGTSTIDIDDLLQPTANPPTSEPPASEPPASEPPSSDPPVLAGASPAPSSTPTSFTTTQLFAWFDGAPASSTDVAGLTSLFARLADDRDPDLASYLAAHRANPRARARWAKILPRPALGRLVHMFVPTEARALLDGVMLLTIAWRQTISFGERRPSPEALWQIVLDHISEPRGVSLPAMLNTLVSELTGDNTRQSAKIRQRVQKLADDGGYATVATALRRTAASRSTAVRPPSPAPERAAAKNSATPPEEPGHMLYTGNAGLVLLHPYLPTFFERLGVLVTGEDGRPHIPPGEPASRAVHLLQYLVDERLDRPEPELVLNKLLCGQPSAQPVARSILPDQADLDLCDEMLHAVIANWPVLSNTSLAGLRETFLQREGRLQHGDAKWKLQVQRKTLDVLIDQVPWSFAVVYHRWMTDPLHVTW